MDLEPKIEWSPRQIKTKTYRLICEVDELNSVLKTTKDSKIFVSETINLSDEQLLSAKEHNIEIMLINKTC